MKLTREQLIHAKDVQLHAVGIARTKNAGWLKQALAREFTRLEVAQFTFATRKQVRSADGRYLLSIDPEKEKSGENVPQEKVLPASKSPNRFSISVVQGTDGHWAAICDNIQAIGMGPTAKAAIEGAAMCIESHLCTMDRAPQNQAWLCEGCGKPTLNCVCAEIRANAASTCNKIAASKESPESFANQLFEESGRDLA